MMLPRPYRLNIKDFLAAVLLLILIIIWFHNVIFDRRIFAYGDLGRYFYPLREFAASSVKCGSIPLWNPYLKNGTPFLAVLQPCIFYPLSLINYLFSSFDTAFNWYIIAHFYLAGIFVYSLMRYWNFSKVASLISSFVFVFGGYLNSVISMNTTLSSVIWLPLIFLFFDMTLKRRSIYAAIITGVLLSIQFLGGEPTIIYCTIWTLFLYAVFYLYFLRKEDKVVKGIAKILGLFSIASILWLFITAAQLLPFLELVANSTRSGSQAFDLVARESILPAELFSFFIPHLFGNTTVAGGHLRVQEWIISFYIGIMPILFILFAIFRKPDRKTLFFTAVLAVSLILAMGKYTPVYNFLYKYIFGFGYIRYPAKFIFLSTFALSILSGIGYDTLSNMNTERRERLAKRLLLINGVLGFLLIIFFTFWGPIYSHIIKFLLSVGSSMMTHFSGAYITFLSDSANLCRLFIIFSLSMLTLFLFLHRKIRVRIFIFLVVSIIFLDLLSINMGICKTASLEIFKKEPKSFSAIKRDEDYFRIMRSDTLGRINQAIWGVNFEKGQYERKMTFASNTAMVHGISDSQGYGSMSKRDRSEFMNLIYMAKRPFKSKLISLLNIKYVISARPIKEDNYEVIFKDEIASFPLGYKGKSYPYFYINKNNACMERVFLVKDAKIVENREEILKLLDSEDFDPAKLVILEEGPLVANPARSPGPDEVRRNNERAEIVSYKPEEVIVEAALNEPKFLILSDSYYPGWKVFVDGKSDNLYRAYYFLRAVYLDKGRHTVRFVFDPLSYKIGKYISLATIALLAIFGLIAYLKSRTKSRN
ncbi:MAG: YfhO family protein [Candidatus Omnitrophica bacterium]|nr:YfhO family protein [Candidatus Omnitrophota bacterium]